MTALILRTLVLSLGLVGSQVVGAGQQNPPSTAGPSGQQNPITAQALESKAIKRVDPVYPPLAKAARVSGIVVVEVTVDSNGDVVAARAVQGHPLLKDAAVAAARGWKFTPSGASGQQTVGTITLTFRLDAPGKSLSETELRSAIDSAMRAVIANPRSADAHRQLGIAYSNNSQYEEAIGEFEEAVRLKPGDMGLLTTLANAYRQNNRIDDAIATWKKAAAVLPDDPSPLRNLVPLFAQRQLYFEAMEAQKRLCELEPSNGSAFINLGFYALRAQAYDKAIEAYKRAVELMPKSAVAYQGLASAYLVSRRFEDALETYQKALNIDPNYVRAFQLQFEIGQAQMALHHPDEALQAFSRSIELRPAYAAGHFAIASVHHARSDYEGAERSLKKVLEISQQNVNALYAIGEVYLHRNRLEDAERSFRDSIKLVSDDPRAHFGLAASLLLQKKESEADDAIAEALKGRVSGTAGYILLGSLLSHLGNDSAAEVIYRRAYAMDANNHLLLNNLGYLMVERDENLDEALKMIQRAVNAQPENASYLDSLGWAYFKLGRLDEAERYLLDAVNHNNNSPVMREHLGDVYQKLGKMALAKGAWQQALSLALERAQTERLKSKLAGDGQK